MLILHRPRKYIDFHNRVGDKSCKTHALSESNSRPWHIHNLMGDEYSFVQLQAQKLEKAVEFPSSASLTTTASFDLLTEIFCNNEARTDASEIFS